MSQPTQLPAVVANARVLYERGDLDSARRMLEYALAGASPADGAGHPDVLQTGRLLAALYREGGDVSAARRTLEEAVAAGRLRWPEDDPLMLLLAYDLGVVAHEFGNRHEARRNLGLVARLGPAVLGATHPVVRAASSYLDPAATQTLPAVGTPVPPLPGARQAAPPPSHAPAPPLRSARQAAPPPTPAPDLPLPSTRQAAPPPPMPSTPARAPAPATAEAVKTLPTPHRAPGGSRTPWVFLAIVLAVLVIAALTTAGVLFFRTGGATPAPGPTAGEPPTQLRLADNGTAITLTWRSPADPVPVIVSVGRAGEQGRSFGTLLAGQTSYTVSGLNPTLEYCFTVVAVYSTEQFTPSELVCTRRAATPPTSGQSPESARSPQPSPTG